MENIISSAYYIKFSQVVGGHLLIERHMVYEMFELDHKTHNMVTKTKDPMTNPYHAGD